MKPIFTASPELSVVSVVVSESSDEQATMPSPRVKHSSSGAIRVLRFMDVLLLVIGGGLPRGARRETGVGR